MYLSPQRQGKEQQVSLFGNSPRSSRKLFGKPYFSSGCLEKQVGDNADVEHQKSLQALEADHKKMVGTLDDIHGNVKGEKDTRDAQHARLHERLEDLEPFVRESADEHDKHMEELGSANVKLKDIRGQADNYKQQTHEHKANMEERLDALETQVCDFADKHQHMLHAIEHASSSDMRLGLSDKALLLLVVIASFAHQVPGSFGMHHESGDNTMPLLVIVKDGGSSHLETVVKHLVSGKITSISELHIELPRLQKECLAQKADIDTINDANANL